MLNLNPPDFEALATEYQNNLDRRHLDELLAEKSIDRLAMVVLGVGWNGEAWTWPIRNDRRQIIGMSLVDRHGKASFMEGSFEGFYIPDCLGCNGGPLLIAEGPFATARCINAGFDAIGRPGVRGNVGYAIAICAGKHVAIISKGNDGSQALADALPRVARSVKVIAPPPQWTPDALKAVINNAYPVTPGAKLRGGERQPFTPEGASA